VIVTDMKSSQSDLLNKKESTVESLRKKYQDRHSAKTEKSSPFKSDNSDNSEEVESAKHAKPNKDIKTFMAESSEEETHSDNSRNGFDMKAWTKPP
jgi:hypothetical protein